jgi:hypothetical protein
MSVQRAHNVKHRAPNLSHVVVDTIPNTHRRRSVLHHALPVLTTQAQLVAPMILGCRFVPSVRRALLQQFVLFPQ